MVTPGLRLRNSRHDADGTTTIAAWVRSDADCLELLAGFLLHVLVQAVAVRVHRDDRGEILHGEMPHRFGRAELEQRHVVYLLDRARVELRGAADGVEVHRAVFLERGE